MNSIRFAIKNSMDVAEKEGEAFVRFSGVSEPFKRVSEREGKSVGVDGGGNPRLVFNTGLDEKKAKFFKWYNEEEQKSVTKQIKELRPLIVDYYGGEEVVAETNKYFWADNRDVSRLSLGNDDMNVFYDTKNPVHALLYLSIISGAFMEVVAPNRDWADRHQIPHYMVLETEENYDDDDIITRSDAHAALAELRKEANPEALFILAWCIQYDTNAFGANLKSTPLRDLITYHSKYIDGKLVTKKKKNTPKVFLEYYEKWKGQQTRPALYAEAYIKAGEYFNFINQREKKYTTIDGTVLGNTIPEAVEAIQKLKNREALDKLRDEVENKWKS